MYPSRFTICKSSFHCIDPVLSRYKFCHVFPAHLLSLLPDQLPYLMRLVPHLPLRRRGWIVFCHLFNPALPDALCLLPALGFVCFCLFQCSVSFVNLLFLLLAATSLD
nr:MAG TPA: hypothetical protein [Caudoviricetes sp.]